MAASALDIEGCAWLDLPHVGDARGHLVFAEGGSHLPFAVARVFYMYGVPRDASRGAHAHRHLRLVLAALAGGVDVLLDDGRAKQTVRLEQPERGLLIGAWVWHELHHFAPATVVLALASGRYEEADYIRDYGQFTREIGQRPKAGNTRSGA